MALDTPNQILDKIIEVIEGKILVKISMEGLDFEKLTIIRDQASQKKGHLSFLIDLPDEFDRFLPDGHHKLILHFEFNGKDNLPYHFKTQEFKKQKGLAWVKFPAIIEKIQKRKDFRISVPHNSRIAFKREETLFEFSVNNISLGGILCYTIGLNTENEKPSLLTMGEELEDVRLIIGSDTKEVTIEIDKAKVVRTEKSQMIKKKGYGIEFIRINNLQKRLLTQVVYQIQREYLKRRLKTKE